MLSRRSVAVFLLATALYLQIHTAQAALATGCASLELQKAPSCFASNVEVLPGLSVAASIGNVSSALLCQTECQRTPNCAYFVFALNKASQKPICQFKPAPGLASVPILTVETSPSTELTDYVSGPVTCGATCVDPEVKELVSGCGPSSPAVCSQLKGVFDSACLISGATGCGIGGYKCCRKCETNSSKTCCTGKGHRISGGYLEGGTSVQSFWKGIHSAEHCHALALITKGATHWSYAFDSPQAFLKGACYLKTYDPINAPAITVAVKDEKAASLETVVGSIDCNGDYGVYLPAERPTISVDDSTTPIVESTDYCSEDSSKKDGFALYFQWGGFTDSETQTNFLSMNASACQYLCRKFPACSHFLLVRDENKCTLLYKDGVTKGDGGGYSYGSRNCGNSAAPAGCFSVGKKGSGEPLGGVQTREAALGCRKLCRDGGNCNLWSYDGVTKNCYRYASRGELVSDANYISGDEGTCVFPAIATNTEGISVRRLLSAADADLTLLEDIPAGCALTGTDFTGGNLEAIGNIDTLKRCWNICVEREDCHYVSYVSADRICYTKWKGEQAENAAVVSVPRVCDAATCLGDQCAARPTAPITPAVSGLALARLGSPEEWIVKGSILDFEHPSTWQRYSILILTDDANGSHAAGSEHCFVSDYVNAKSCWNRRHELLPISFRIQVVAVAANAEFSGWSHFPWEAPLKPHDNSSKEFELLKEDMHIVESGKVNSDHGLFTRFIVGALPIHWPHSFTSPNNFAQGIFYARFQTVTSTPSKSSVKVMLCIVGSDDPVSEICSHPAVLPPV